MDAVSGLFLNALGTDMVTMEEYFPFITKAFDVMQYTAWAVLFLIVVWQLFRAFGGPITEAENPWQLVVRGAIFALLIGYAKTNFHAGARHCQSAVYGTDGCKHDGGGIHLCRCGAGTEQRTADNRFNRDGCAGPYWF